MLEEDARENTYRNESHVRGPPQSGCLVSRRRGEHRRIWAEGALESVPLMRRERFGFRLRVESQLLRLLLRGGTCRLHHLAPTGDMAAPCTCQGRHLLRLLLGELDDRGDGHSLKLVHVARTLVRHGRHVNA